jgi:hypothetical protein
MILAKPGAVDVISVLVPLGVLLALVFYPGPPMVARKRRSGWLCLLAISMGAPFVTFPVALLIADERAALAGQWTFRIVALAAPLVAWALVGLLGPAWVRGWVQVTRAAMWLATALAAEYLALFAGVPVNSRPVLFYFIGYAAAATCAAAWRLTHPFRRPVHVLVGAALVGAMVVATAWWVLAQGGTLRPDPLTGAETAQAAVLLLLILSTVSGYGLCVGLWRLFHWRRYGPPPAPPARPAPPTWQSQPSQSTWPTQPDPANWPPVAGDVWNAMVEHEDGTAKDRPVLVWEAGDTHVDILKITSQDKSHLPRYYLPLPWRDWHEVLAKDSWLELQIKSVPYSAFRNMRGQCLDPTWRKVCHRIPAGDS